MAFVAVPWRDDGHRILTCTAVCAALRHMLPGSPVVLTDSGHEPFNRSASRNLGVRAADPGEIVVVCDADTLPEPLGLATALRRAYDGRLHYPFAVVNYLSEVGTLNVLRGNQPDPAQIEHSIPSAQGGIMVMRASAWLEAGGMDEQFIGWGYEDNAFYAKVARMIGPPVHHPGVAWHLWHPAQRYQGSTEETNNFFMARRAIDGS